MRVFRRVMLGGGIDIDTLPNTQKIYYKATAKVTPKKDSLGATVIVNKWDDITGEGIIVCSRDITIINSEAFINRSVLTSVTIPDSVTSIGEDAFYNCISLTNVTIGNGVTSIGYRAFYNCNSLTSVTIPDGVTSIGGNVFSTCSSLTSVTIPDSVTSIGDNAFGGCYNLTAFYGKYASEDNRCLIIDGELCSFARYGKYTYTIPDNVTSIRKYVFYKCRNLTGITIPDSVTSIGDSAFGDCDSLINITIPNNVTSINRETFSGCTSLTSVTIGNSVTSIGWYAFRYCNSMQYYDFSTHESVPKLTNTNSINDIPSTCKIIVPDALYDEWIAATNWNTYASYIIKKSDWDASQTTE